MHTRGRPEDMYAHAEYGDVVGGRGHATCSAASTRAQDFGVARQQLIVDPGLGFAKRAAQSLAALAGFDRLG